MIRQAKKALEMEKDVNFNENDSKSIALVAIAEQLQRIADAL